MATVSIGIFLTAGEDVLLQTALALAVYGVAAEGAAAGDPGPGTFRSRLLDEIAAIGDGGVSGLRVSEATVGRSSSP